MNDFWSRIEARQTLRTATDFEHERLGADHVDEIVLPMLPMLRSNAHMKSLRKLKICAKVGRT